MRRIVVTENYTVKQTNVLLDIQKQARINLYGNSNGAGIKAVNNSDGDVSFYVPSGKTVNDSDSYTLPSGTTVTFSLDGDDWFISESDVAITSQLEHIAQQYISVQTTTDGTLDNTIDVENAVLKAEAENKGVFFPFNGNGVYVLTRAIILKSNMVFACAKGVKITKKDAITQNLTQDTNMGDNFVYVADSSVYEIGSDIFIHNTTDYLFPGNGTRAKITELDNDLNKITFTAYRSNGIKQGDTLTKNPYVSNTHSLFTTNGYLYAAENISISGFILDGNRQVDEPKAWVIAPIHIDPQTLGTEQGINYIYNNEIIHSSTDGISIQSENFARIYDNKVDDCGQKGIHVGTTIDKVRVYDNDISNCEENSVYWCYNIDDMIVNGNTIKDCFSGFEGIDGAGNTSIVSCNIFDSIDEVAIRIAGQDGFKIGNNIFKNIDHDVNSASIDVYVGENIDIKDNTFEDITTLGAIIDVKAGHNVNVVGNTINNFTGDEAIHFGSVSSTLSEDCKIVGNTITNGSIHLENCKNIIISENNVTPKDGESPLYIAPTAIDTIVNNNQFDGIIIDEGIRTRINGVTQESLNGLEPNLLYYSAGEKVIDIDTSLEYTLDKTSTKWIKVVGAEVEGLDLIYNAGVETEPIVDGLLVGDGSTRSKEATYLHLSALNSTGTTARSIYVTDNTIDLTNITRLYIDWEHIASSGYHYAELLLHQTDKNGYLSELTLSNRNNSPREVQILDVSSLSGSYYIKMSARSGASGVASVVNVYKLGFK